MHDSFPHSLELSRAGYTAFALIYRPDDPYNDLAHVITFAYDNAEINALPKIIIPCGEDRQEHV